MLHFVNGTHLGKCSGEREFYYSMHAYVLNVRDILNSNPALSYQFESYSIQTTSNQKCDCLYIKSIESRS